VRLRQALDNLIANAVAHAEPGTDVLLRVLTEPGRVLIAVSNAGEGIADRDRARIFEPGVRLDSGRPGLGIGLSVSRGIAEAHGGSLTVTSAARGGTTFTLALPAGAR
jgi:signal transduction histidine kinase